LYVIVEIDFEVKGGEVMVIRRKQGKRGGSKKVKMPRVEFDMEAIKEIKKRRKGSQKRR
jgi:hypothetical protein